jgi:sialate O-acetylesterase
MKRLLLLICFLPVVSVAQLRLAKIFSDNMVLQRHQPIHFWGKAKPGEKVKILFGEENELVTGSKDSLWNIYCNKRKVSTQAQSLIFPAMKKNLS